MSSSTAPLDAAAPQPAPAPGRLRVLPLVLADLERRSPAAAGEVGADLVARDRMGTRKYGTSLMTCNGRDALTDAYQEALDLVMYLRQEVKERGLVGDGADALSVIYQTALDLVLCIRDELANRRLPPRGVGP